MTQDRYYVAFHEAFDLLVDDFRKNKKYLEDKRLSHAEKQILQAHMLIRNNKNTEVFELLSSITPQNEYFNAHKKLVLGMASINTGRHQQALNYFQESEKDFSYDYDRKFLFLLFRNGFIAGLNLAQVSICESYLQKLKNLKVERTREALLIQFSSFNLNILKANAQTALIEKDELDKQKSEMSPSDLPAYLINCFHLSMLVEDFAMAKDVMNELKNLKKFYLSENYKFMNSLLAYLLEDAPIYLREEDMRDVQTLNLQVQCLKYLSQDDIHMAIQYWDKLKNLNPAIYLHDFEFKGPKNLFSLCLRKALLSIKKERINVPETLTMFEKLDLIFSELDGVISKDELFEYLWNRKIQDKSDLQKLSRLIYKYKISSVFEIQTHHGSYKVNRKKTA